jgi:hypothetical protein
MKMSEMAFLVDVARTLRRGTAILGLDENNNFTPSQIPGELSIGTVQGGLIHINQ